MGWTIAPVHELGGNERDGSGLGGLGVPIDPSGVVLGRDGEGQPVLVRLFGPSPLTVVLVGGWWAAQILVYRCLGHGAVVVVDALDTGSPGLNGTMARLSHWLTMDDLAGATGDRVRVMAGDLATSWPASVGQPLLRLHDAGPTGPSVRPASQPWHTELIMLARLTPASLPLVSAADVVLVQRLNPPEAAQVGSALRLAPDVIERLGTMDNEMIAAFRGPATGYALLTPTALEREAFG